jgi:multidrug efflux pump subunit AcrB
MMARRLAIIVVLLGAVALWRLPVALYPALVPPTVQVTAHYPGASAEAVAKAVALPIEQQVNVVPGMLYMQSESGADGTYTLTVTFATGTDIDVAQTLVQRRVAGALPALPNAVQAQGVSVQPKSTDVLMFVAFSSPENGPENLYAGVAGELARLPGVVVQTCDQGFMLDGHPAAGIAVSQVPGANALAVTDAVRARMAQLVKTFPPGLAYSVPFDATLYARAAINELYRNLFEAVILVLAVILVFLQDWRATMMAGITIGVTVVGAFAAIAALGFSVNVATLLAIVVSVAVSVEAAEPAAGGCSAPMIRTSLVVLAVFIPVAFLRGLPGQMLAPFALVMVEAVLITLLVAAALTPTRVRNVPRRHYNPIYQSALTIYLLLVRRMLPRAGLVVLAALLLGVFAIWGLVQIPGGLLPTEDQGYVLLATQVPNSASLDRTRSALEQIGAAVQRLPGVDHVVTIAGLSTLDGDAPLANAGVSYVMLKDRRERDGLQAIAAGLPRALESVRDANILAIMPPAIPGIGSSGGFTMQLELRDGSLDYPRLAAITRLVVAHAATQSGLSLLAGSAAPPALIGRYGLYPSSSVRGTAASGFSSSEAMALMEQMAAQTLPPGIGYDWTAMSYLEKSVGGQILVVFAVAIVLVYLVLAARYRSWLAPLCIILVVPLALLGPLVALDVLRLDNDLLVQIGLLLLIALTSRNAMRIVDVARRRRAEGMAISETALHAARVSLPPMLMTALASILGVMPLVSAHGAAAAARFSIGITLFSGLIASTCLTALFVPSFFVVMQKFAERRGKPGQRARRKQALESVATRQSGSGVTPGVP